jgi:hypothetical protein
MAFDDDDGDHDDDRGGFRSAYDSSSIIDGDEGMSLFQENDHFILLHFLCQLIN